MRPGSGSADWQRCRSWLFLCALALTVGGCRTQTPEERIESLRSLYAAQVTGIVVKQDPLLPDGDSADVGADTEETGEAPSEIPVSVEVVLDVLVSTEATEKLPGLTLEVSHGGADGREKEHRLIWVDTAKVERGPGTQMTVVLDDVDYQAGDGFHVEVRNRIPVEERSKYREFGQ